MGEIIDPRETKNYIGEKIKLHLAIWLFSEYCSCHLTHINAEFSDPKFCSVPVWGGDITKGTEEEGSIKV